MQNAGSAYVFKNTSGTWAQIQKIVASDRGAEDKFGFAVSISGDYLVVGALFESEDEAGGNKMWYSGSAYVYKNNSGNWSQVKKIVASDRAAEDLFGSSVAISGNYMIIGAYADDEDATGKNTFNGSGSAYIFKNKITSCIASFCIFSNNNHCLFIFIKLNIGITCAKIYDLASASPRELSFFNIIKIFCITNFLNSRTIWGCIGYIQPSRWGSTAI